MSEIIVFFPGVPERKETQWSQGVIKSPPKEKELIPPQGSKIREWRGN